MCVNLGWLQNTRNVIICDVDHSRKKSLFTFYSFILVSNYFVLVFCLFDRKVLKKSIIFPLHGSGHLNLLSIFEA